MPIPLVGAVPKARYVLGAVRLFNGAATLFATRPFGKRLGVDPDTSPAAVDALRLFGVRTIYRASWQSHCSSGWGGALT
ncbi:hypothetical protein BH20ACT18_BH20ACT18_08410 [soil metagenome]